MLFDNEGKRVSRRFVSWTSAVILAAALGLLSGCSSVDAGPVTTSVLRGGDAYSSGWSDDGRFFYRTSVGVSRGEVRISAIRWAADDGSVPTAINLTPGSFEGGDGGGAAYQAGDNTNALPITLDAERVPSAVVTVVFDSLEAPAGQLELVDDSGEILQITPSWE